MNIKKEAEIAEAIVELLGSLEYRTQQRVLRSVQDYIYEIYREKGAKTGKLNDYELANF